MITHEEYLKAKAIVEEYEEQEYKEATLEAMYCVECQAFHIQECFCDFLEEQDELYKQILSEDSEEDDH